MRILTWNVNVLRTVLDYHPWSSMKNKSVEGLLDELGADIFCFQEHKTRRQQVDKAMACPGRYDAFWTWPRSKSGYSGVCTYVNSDLCVPLRAEEGITGLLLKDKSSTMRPPWTDDEMIGSYPNVYTLDLMEEVDGSAFDVRTIDMEGRAVVCDFGMFVLFNLYCPNETNETRRPYKMNFLRILQARVEKLIASGREVIIAGDINVMRAPLDSGEGGIRSTAEQHYSHPARVWFNEWCAPKGPMIDVVRESFPDREGMFTCWNTKIDARSANYGTRIDYILCSPGLRPWIKGGDIQADLYGSDHCPVYVDLHDSIDTPTGRVHIKDLLNPTNRPPSTAPIYPSDRPRDAPEPPRFATKFLDEFSAKQRTLMSLWGKPKPIPTPSLVLSEKTEEEALPTQLSTQPSEPTQSSATEPEAQPTSAFGIARAAFESLNEPRQSATNASRTTSSPSTQSPSRGTPSLSEGPSQSAVVAPPPSKRPVTVDLTDDDDGPAKKAPKPASRTGSKTGQMNKTLSKKPVGQQKLASFWSQPKVSTENAPSPPPTLQDMSPTIPSADEEAPDTMKDEMLAQALAEADAEREKERDARKESAAPVWSNLFAKKLPPLCTVHQAPCKDFIVKIPGPNKGKRFWLCSRPVGPGYDMGRSKRPREEVDRQYRCDYFLWDSANSRKEAPKIPSKDKTT